MIKKQLTELPSQFKKVLPLMHKLQSSGFEVYFVGGGLRDWLLNYPINDIDLATNALPLEVKKIFPHSFDTGIQHGTVTVVYQHENYEITTFRSDGDYLDHRHPKNVKFVRNLKEDLKRRDFTINALAMSPQGEIVDYYGGIQDLHQQLIRCVLNPYDRFEEDALRIFRAIRFTSQLNFHMENNTFQALVEKVPLLAEISIERLHNEFIKMMQGAAWQKGLQLINQTKIANYLPDLQIPELKNGLNPQYCDLKFNKEETIWAFLFSLKIFPANKVDLVLKDWRTSNSIIKNVKEIIAFCQNYQKGIRGYQLLYGLQLDNLKDGVFILEKLEHLDLSSQIIKEYELLPIHQISDLAVSGKDLIQNAGFTPGVNLGKMIKLIEQEVLKKELNNNYQSIINFARKNNV